MNEFKDQLDTAEKDKVTKLIGELRELAVKGQAADPSITAEIIKEKIDATQQASLGLFQKVRLFTDGLFFVETKQNAHFSTGRRSTRRGTLRTTPRHPLNRQRARQRAPRVTRRRRIKLLISLTLPFVGRMSQLFFITSPLFPSHHYPSTTRL
jgi:hypothetical protein